MVNKGSMGLKLNGVKLECWKLALIGEQNNEMME